VNVVNCSIYVVTTKELRSKLHNIVAKQYNNKK